MLAEESAVPLSPNTPPESPEWLMLLMATGVIAAIIWTIRRVRYPTKFRLTQTPGRQNRLDPLLLLTAVIFVFFLSQLVFLGVKQMFLASIGESHAELLALAGTQVLQIPIWILLGHWAFNRGAYLGMGLSLRHWPAGVVRGVITGLTAVPVCLLCQSGIIVISKWFGAGDPTDHMLISAFKAAPIGWRWLIAFSVIVLAPLAEELLFRGLFQSALRRLFGKPWPAIAITAVLFGLVHYMVWTSIIPLALFAVMLGYSYERTGKLLSPIVAHAVFNALFLLASLST